MPANGHQPSLTAKATHQHIEFGTGDLVSDMELSEQSTASIFSLFNNFKTNLIKFDRITRNNATSLLHMKKSIISMHPRVSHSYILINSMLSPTT